MYFFIKAALDSLNRSRRIRDQGSGDMAHEMVKHRTITRQPDGKVVSRNGKFVWESSKKER